MDVWGKRVPGLESRVKMILFPMGLRRSMGTVRWTEEEGQSEWEWEVMGRRWADKKGRCCGWPRMEDFKLNSEHDWKPV